MFARRLNDLTLTIELRPVDVVLVKEGRHLEHGDKERRVFHRGTHVIRNPPRPRLRDGPGYDEYDTADGTFDMACVSTQLMSGAQRFYLPGSSLRGVMRGAAERIVGRWRPDLLSEPFVINDGEHPGHSGGQRLDRLKQQCPGLTLDGPLVYRQALPIERCFGHSALRGRWQIADAWLHDEERAFRSGQVRVDVRDGVGIDRRTGAAKNKIKFQFEALNNGLFVTTMRLINYEHWQLGLLAHVLAALDSGAVRVGYGTRRGLGRMRVVVTDMLWRWYGVTPPREGTAMRLPTLTELAERANLFADYGWHEPHQDARLPLTAVETCLGSEARMTPASVERSGGLRVMDWAAEPWPTLARLLPSALAAWQREEVSGDC